MNHELTICVECTRHHYRPETSRHYCKTNNGGSGINYITGETEFYPPEYEDCFDVNSCGLCPDFRRKDED